MSDVSAVPTQLQGDETEHHEVIVIGAGFGGIYAVYRFRNQGLDVLCLEAAPDVGSGVTVKWRLARYRSSRGSSEPFFATTLSLPWTSDHETCGP